MKLFMGMPLGAAIAVDHTADELNGKFPAGAFTAGAVKRGDGVQDIFIGVDGGATKCKVRVEDAEGNLLGQALGGPANIRLSVEMAWQSILQPLEEILRTHNISLRDKDFRFHAGPWSCRLRSERSLRRIFAGPQSFFQPCT